MEGSSGLGPGRCPGSEAWGLGLGVSLLGLGLGAWDLGLGVWVLGFGALG